MVKFSFFFQMKGKCSICLIISSYEEYCKEIKSLSEKLQKLDPKDPFRIKLTTQLLEKLFIMGLIMNKKNLGVCDSITPESFAKRRLPVMLVKLGYINKLSHAINLVLQGQVR
jgi:U3 small nucleolar ribonucleoprotein protein IMP3